MRAMLRVWLPFILFVFIAIFDPFALYSSSNKVSRELAFRALALWQGPLAREQVAVVLLDDSSADALNGEFGYPVTFHNHAEIVRTILCAGPASLFIDFSFRNIRTRDPQARTTYAGHDISVDLDDLIRALQTRSTAGDRFCPTLTTRDGRHAATDSRIFVARTRSISEDNCDPLFERYPGSPPLPQRCRAAREIALLATVAEPLTMARADPDGAYLVTVDPAATYALLPAGRSLDGPVEMSPALAAMLAFCEQLEPERQQRFRGCRERGDLKDLMQTPGTNRRLVPMWGYFRVGSGERPGAQAGCLPAQIAGEGNAVFRIGVLLAEIGRALVRGQTSPTSELFGKGLCLPNETVTASELINLGANCGGRDRAACRMEQAGVSAGRMVFYGASVADVHDVVESAVLGVVPGVAIHAAAAANLLEHGTAFVREPLQFNLWAVNLEGNQVAEIFFLFAWFVFLRNSRAARTLSGGLAAHLVIVILALAVAILATSLTYSLLNWSPANWLGLAAALAGTRPDMQLAPTNREVT